MGEAKDEVLACISMKMAQELRNAELHRQRKSRFIRRKEEQNGAQFVDQLQGSENILDILVVLINASCITNAQSINEADNRVATAAVDGVYHRISGCGFGSNRKSLRIGFLSESHRVALALIVNTYTVVEQTWDQKLEWSRVRERIVQRVEG